MSSPRDGMGPPPGGGRALTPITYVRIAARMSAADPVLAGVVARWGPPPYARGVALAIVAGTLDLMAPDVAPDDEVRRALVSVRGVGRWTADVDLLFALRRADAWPSGDLALAKAVQELWGLEALPTWSESTHGRSAGGHGGRWRRGSSGTTTSRGAAGDRAPGRTDAPAGDRHAPASGVDLERAAWPVIPRYRRDAEDARCPSPCP